MTNPANDNPHLVAILKKKIAALSDDGLEGLLKETIEKIKSDPTLINKIRGMMVYNLIGEELSKRFSGVFNFDQLNHNNGKLYIVK